MTNESPLLTAPPATTASLVFFRLQAMNFLTALCRRNAMLSGSKSWETKSSRSDVTSGGLYEGDIRREASISLSFEPGRHETAKGGPALNSGDLLLNVSDSGIVPDSRDSSEGRAKEKVRCPLHSKSFTNFRLRWPISSLFTRSLLLKTGMTLVKLDNRPI